MATFVLVPGAWLGGQAWDAVAAELRTQRHDVYPLSLTGLGERAPLASPDVDLDTHISDIVTAISGENLRDVILVGHSYGGIPVTGAADRIPERLGRVVYLESGPLPSGVSHMDTQSAEAADFTRKEIAEHGDGWQWPFPTWEQMENIVGASLDGLGPAERERMRSQAKPQPAGTLTQQLQLTHNPATAKLPKTLITCMMPLAELKAMIDSGDPFFAGMTGSQWSYDELPTGHWPMFSRPRDLAGLLAQIAAPAS